MPWWEWIVIALLVVPVVVGIVAFAIPWAEESSGLAGPSRLRVVVTVLVVIAVLVGAGLIYAATDQPSANDGTWDVVGSNQFGDDTYGCTYP